MGACSGRGGQGPEVIFHADDFGMTVRQSAEMLSLAGVLGGDGALSSVSIMVGSPAARESARLIAGAEGRLRVSLHLNLVEGPCTADPAEIPLLVDDTGRFRLGFAGLLARSTGPVASELERQKYESLKWENGIAPTQAASAARAGSSPSVPTIGATTATSSRRDSRSKAVVLAAAPPRARRAPASPKQKTRRTPA